MATKENTVIRRFAFCGIALLLIIMAGLPLLAQVPSSFSSDMRFASPKGMSGTGKLYFAGQKVRMEMNAQGHNSIMISDQSRKIAYVVMPQQKMYMEMSTDKPGPQRGPDWQAYDAANPCRSLRDTTCEKIGTEVVDGRMCNKWKFAGSSSSRTVWIDQKNGIPIKSLMSDGTTMELTNIKEGPQSASLFEVPAGYQKMDMGNMMRNAPRP
jgi:outer membrane lipoprotein-sorting protein